MKPTLEDALRAILRPSRARKVSGYLGTPSRATAGLLARPVRHPRANKEAALDAPRSPQPARPEVCDTILTQS